MYESHFRRFAALLHFGQIKKRFIYMLISFLKGTKLLLHVPTMPVYTAVL